MFHPLTPIISSIIGDNIRITATTVYPIRAGEIDGGPVINSVPVPTPTPTPSLLAKFTPEPSSGTLDSTSGSLHVEFDGSDSTGSITAWSWGFGDGATDTTGPTTSRDYTTGGGFNVTLTVKNGPLTSTTSHLVEVTTQSGLLARFDPPPPGPANQVVSFNGSASTGSITSWSWDFGDEATDTTGPNPSHTYTSPGTFIVTLTVKDAQGSSTTTRTITVTEPLCTVPTYDRPDGCRGEDGLVR